MFTTANSCKGQTKSALLHKSTATSKGAHPVKHTTVVQRNANPFPLFQTTSMELGPRRLTVTVRGEDLPLDSSTSIRQTLTCHMQSSMSSANPSAKLPNLSGATVNGTTRIHPRASLARVAGLGGRIIRWRGFWLVKMLVLLQRSAMVYTMTPMVSHADSQRTVDGRTSNPY
jgi:hypothetical protein